MIRIHLYILIILICNNNLLQAQEPVFSQYYFNPVYMNPALAGIDNQYKFCFNGRQQWSRIPSQFNTTSISYDSWSNYTNSGFSILNTNNVEGEGLLTTNKFSTGLSYRLLDKNNSPIKFQVGFHWQRTTKTIDWSKLVFMDDLDPIYGDIFSSAFVPYASNRYIDNNFTLGSVFIYRFRRGARIGRKTVGFNLDTELGFAVNNLMQRPDAFFSPYPQALRKYTLHGSFIKLIRKKGSSQAIKGSFFYQEHGILSTLQFGIKAIAYPLQFGVYYRSQLTTIDRSKKESLYWSLSCQRVIPQANMLMIFSYSRDETISKLNTSTNGINEISIIIQSTNGGILSRKFKEKRKKNFHTRTLGCYDVFTTHSIINTRMGGLNPNPNLKTPWLKKD